MRSRLDREGDWGYIGEKLTEMFYLHGICVSMAIVMHMATLNVRQRYFWDDLKQANDWNVVVSSIARVIIIPSIHGSRHTCNA